MLGNHQVKKMRSIYENAELVVVSLAEAAEDSHLAFDLARELVTMERFSGNDGIEQIMSSERTKDFCAFHLLLTRSYWTRVWVVQEVNSARQVHVLCGDDSIPWKTLLRAQNIINSNQAALWDLVRDEPRQSNFTSDVWYEGPRGLLSHIESEEPSLFEALRWHCTKESTLAEDKVYAILGITSAKNDPQLVIDYSRGAQPLFIDTAKYIIRSTRRLDVICGVQKSPHSKSDMNLPSWVVNWVDAYTSCLLDGSTGVAEAAASSEARFVFGQDGKSVTVEGMCLGITSTLAENPAWMYEYESSEPDLDILEKFYLWCLTCPRLAAPENTTLPGLLDSFRNFICGRILKEVDLLAELSDGEAVETILAVFAFRLVKKENRILPRPLQQLVESISRNFTDDYLETWAKSSSTILKPLWPLVDSSFAATDCRDLDLENAVSDVKSAFSLDAPAQSSSNLWA
jgi:hypothetical protein